MAIKECVVCGGSFEGRGEPHRHGPGVRGLRAKTCGPQCSILLRRQNAKKRSGVVTEHRTCVICGATFHVRGQRRKITCSDSCAVENKARKDAARHDREYVPKRHILQCVVCGTDFVRNRNKITCSDRCSRKRNGDLNKVREAKYPREQLLEYGRAYRAKRQAAYNIIDRIKTEGLSALL